MVNANTRKALKALRVAGAGTRKGQGQGKAQGQAGKHKAPQAAKSKNRPAWFRDLSKDQLAQLRADGRCYNCKERLGSAGHDAGTAAACRKPYVPTVN